MAQPQQDMEWYDLACASRQKTGPHLVYAPDNLYWDDVQTLNGRLIHAASQALNGQYLTANEAARATLSWLCSEGFTHREAMAVSVQTAIERLEAKTSNAKESLGDGLDNQELGDSSPKSKGHAATEANSDESRGTNDQGVGEILSRANEKSATEKLADVRRLLDHESSKTEIADKAELKRLRSRVSNYLKRDFDNLRDGKKWFQHLSEENQLFIHAARRILHPSETSSNE